MKLKSAAKSAIKALPEPVGGRVLAAYKAAKYHGLETFSGWGMTTETLPPWDNQPDTVSNLLLELHSEFKAHLRDGDFTLSQFAHIEDLASFMDEFVWREYFIITSVALAVESISVDEKMMMVEGGVCDGWTAWFAIRSTCRDIEDLEYWAYDSWAAMREQDLLPAESWVSGTYAYLDLKQTRRNLRQFGQAVRYCEGFIPASLREFDGPSQVHWLHIDINSAMPTESMMAHFWDRMPKGGVVLLDDYSHRGFEDTKRLVDEFLVQREQWVLALPTGQGLLIKR